MSGGFQLEDVAVEASGRTVLRVPELRLPAGVTSAVVGPSGAGKSTLLRLLAGLQAPTHGRVLWNGAPPQPGQVVMVFQRPALLHGTVAMNVALPLQLRGQRNAAQQVPGWLARLGLRDKARQQVHTLSGGEYQRVALARALILEPAALLLDEPTSNLDPENVRLIEDLVRGAQKETGSTVVWVTHQPVQARRVADSALLLMEGAVVEHAPVATFFGPWATQRTQDFLGGRTVW